MRLFMEIVGVGQTVNLHTKEVEHVFQAVLPDGTSITVPSTETLTEKFIQLSVEGSDSDAWAQPGVPEQPYDDDVEGPSGDLEEYKEIFGTEPTEPPPPPRGVPREAVAKMASLSAAGRKAGIEAVPSMIIPTDDYGNPQVTPRMITPNEEDADGVPQA
jgi:hypothetical protein